MSFDLPIVKFLVENSVFQSLQPFPHQLGAAVPRASAPLVGVEGDLVQCVAVDAFGSACASVAPVDVDFVCSHLQLESNAASEVEAGKVDCSARLLDLSGDEE